jgi:hypothetical protein
MYGIFTNICPRNHPNVGKYTIHGAYGEGWPKGGQIGKKTTMFPMNWISRYHPISMRWIYLRKKRYPRKSSVFFNHVPIK